MIKLLLVPFAALVLLTGCEHLGLDNKPSCYESVAISKITITEAYNTAASLSEAGKISVDTATNLLISIDHADSLVDSAQRLCSVDEASAYDYLQVAKDVLGDSSNLMQEYEDEQI